MILSPGSIETLNKTDIGEQLQQYYHGSYSADIMQLVILGREPLSTLEGEEQPR
jgi:secreted Zn-dependent insulinase-like peptidase